MSITILANHAHVFPARLNADGTVDRLLRLMDVCGIAQAVCFAPFPHQFEETDILPNHWLAEEIAQNDRLYGFGTLDLRRAHVREPIEDQVKRIADLGLRGIKMHPNAQQFDVLSREALVAYKAAEELGLFITFHTGVHHYRIAHYHVLKFDEVAELFPGLRFSMEHVGGYHFFPEALAVIFNRIPFPPVPGKRCLVYGGLTSVFTPHYNRFWYMPRDRMLELIAQVGAEQLIFGLDFPYNLEANTRLALDTLTGLGLTQEQLTAILGGNLRQALGLSEVAPHPAERPEPMYGSPD